MTGQSEVGDLADLYREVILDHNKRPRNFRTLDDASRSAHGDNPLCGDTVTVYLDLADERIDEVAWQGQGCAISQASASLMTDAVRGLDIGEARELAASFRELLTGPDPAAAETLGKLAVFAGVRDYPMRVKCATLAWHTLSAALVSDDDVPEDPVTTESKSGARR